jgi:hypothetical protein
MTCEVGRECLSLSRDYRKLIQQPAPRRQQQANSFGDSHNDGEPIIKVRWQAMSSPDSRREERKRNGIEHRRTLFLLLACVAQILSFPTAGARFSPFGPFRSFIFNRH